MRYIILIRTTRYVEEKANMKNRNIIKWKPYALLWEISEDGNFVRVNEKLMEKLVTNNGR